MRTRWFAIAVVLVVLGCSQATEVGDGDGGTVSVQDGDSGSGGAAGSGGTAGSAGSAGSTGGEPSGGSGETGGTGGESGTAGGASGEGGTGGRDAGSVDCSMVGCAAPPLCSTGCTEQCGCCPCSEGDTMGAYVCKGGCWAEDADGGNPEGCNHNGVFYPVGASFPAGDGCNSCTCTEGGLVACTEMACICNPAAEMNRREYIGTSPAQCAAMDFICPENTTYFWNDCGCGCEQDPSCPEWFNCVPGPGTPPCDVDDIQARCPYSGIAY